MTRRLPWDRDALERLPNQRTPATVTPRKAATPQRATPKTAATPASFERSNHAPARSHGLPGDRSPSTSPPPEPLPETFMIEGLDNDDMYRMVEDELSTIAGQFTAHLHAAEYHRLKAQTRSQNAETIKNISRPVVGSLTELARKRQEELLRKKKQRQALRQAKQAAGRDDEESGDETGAPWRGTSLQGLMQSPRKREVPLMALTRADSGMRTADLFGGVVRPHSKRPTAAMERDEEEEEEETNDESDDLGGHRQVPLRREAMHIGPATTRPAHPSEPVAKAPSRHVTQQRTTSKTSNQLAEDKTTAHSRVPPTSMATQPASSAAATARTAPSVNEHEDNDDEDDDDIFTRFKNRRANSKPQRRGPEKKGEKPGSKERRDIIPSFI